MKHYGPFAGLIVGAGILIILVIIRSNGADEQETRACAAICGSPYVEVLTPRYNRSHLCLCPATGGDGPRGQHWTLAYLDGGTP